MSNPRQQGLGRPFAARYIGMILAMASAVAFMIGARPVAARDAGDRRPAVASMVGAGLGAMSVTGFVAGSALERRARQADEMRVATRVNGRDLVG